MSTGQMSPMEMMMLQQALAGGGQQAPQFNQGATGPYGHVQQAAPASALGSMGGLTAGINKMLIMQALKKKMGTQQPEQPMGPSDQELQQGQAINMMNQRMGGSPTSTMENPPGA